MCIVYAYICACVCIRVCVETTSLPQRPLAHVIVLNIGVGFMLEQQRDVAKVSLRLVDCQK